MALIECPECGRQISSLAHSCPHCGAENSDNPITERHARRAKADGATGSWYHAKHNGHHHLRISKKKLRIILLSTLGGVVLIGCVGWLLYHNHQLAAEEEARYEALMDNFSIADAETFLLKYPDTEHLQDIQDNIKLYQRYEQEWAKIVASTNVDDFAMFRSKFPNSPFDERAYDKIDSLDWTYAKRSDTEGALQKYLDLHPDGKYAELAREQKQLIIDTRPTAEERSYINRVINAYFAALTDRNKDALANITTSAVFGRSCDFIDGHEGAGAANYTIVSPVGVEKRPTDDGPVYAAICTVSKAATAADGTAETKSYGVRASLNTQLQISAITMTAQE